MWTVAVVSHTISFSFFEVLPLRLAETHSRNPLICILWSVVPLDVQYYSNFCTIGTSAGASPPGSADYFVANPSDDSDARHETDG